MKPYRDKLGRYAKRPARARDASGRFTRRVKRGPAKKHKTKKGGKPRRVSKLQKARKFYGQQHAPTYNLCYAADRQAFYDDVIAQRKKLRKKLTEEEMSAVRVVVDVIGKPPKKRTKKGKLSKRKTTAFIGRRSFSDLRRFRRFLLLEQGYGAASSRNPFNPDWRKSGMCQYEKTASLEIRPERGRGRIRTLKKFKIGE